jgi:cobalt-zinc-cadmium efflux system membrane fusion protein
MSSHGKNLVKLIAIGVGCILLVGLSAAAMPLVKSWWPPATEEAGSAHAPSSESELVNKDTLRLPRDVVRSLQIETGEVRQAKYSQDLEMYGQFAPDPDRLFRIRARFGGHVAEVGQKSGATESPGKATGSRPLRVGDHVKKGDLLAVVWSRDLGEKKSELVDGLSQLWLDELLQKELRKGYQEGAVPLRQVLDQDRKVEADRIAVDRAERTLRSWELGDADIEALRQEAQRIQQRKGIRNPEQYRKWARWEVRAPFSGTVVEKNANLGEWVDTTSLPLFQIADFSQLTVWAYPYEEDLPMLQKLPKPIPWTIRLKADPQAKPMRGTIDLVLPIIEPNQRTPILRGSVQNPTGQLLSNQSLTTSVELPAPTGEMEVPTTALVDTGRESLVFVQPDPSQFVYQLRHVNVVRRFFNVVHVNTRVPAEKGQPESQPLRPGDRVVTSGAVLLLPYLDDLRTK